MGYSHDTEKVGLDSPTAREIIGTMNIRKPISTQRFLEKFIQVRVYRQNRNLFYVQIDLDTMFLIFYFLAGFQTKKA